MQTNEIVEKNSAQLPDTLEDLTQFVLVGKAKLQAYMLKLQTINKLSTAQEIRDQTLKEAQEISTALIAAEQRIGELLLSIPKQSGGDRRSEDFKNRDGSNFEKSKSETIRGMGYSKDEALDYQQMAKNPEVVQKVIEDALANGEVVTKTQVMKEIKTAKDEIAEKERKIRELERDSKEREDYITELESREPVVKEVIPTDYESLKKKAKEADAWKKDFQKQQEKTGEKQKEILKLEEKIKELQMQTIREQTHNDLIGNVVYFIAQCGSFIRDVGGYIWIAEKLAEIPEKDREGYVRATNAVYSWAATLLDAIRRDEEYGEPELRKLITEHTSEGKEV